MRKSVRRVRRGIVLSAVVAVFLAPCIVSTALADEVVTQLFLFGVKPSEWYRVQRNFGVIVRPIGTRLGTVAWMSYSHPGVHFRVMLTPGNEVLAGAGAGVSVEADTELSQNYPNPFNPRTSIPFTLARAGRVLLRVFDARGAHVATLFDGSLREGRHSLEWMGRNDQGQPVASGMYFYTLTTNGQTLSRKMLVLK